MTKIPIALATDENYAQYCATTMVSALVNSGSDIELVFYILVCEMAEETRNKFLQLKKIKNCQINFIEVNGQFFRNFPAHFHFSLEAYFRLKLASLLPNIDKILYLDCDMIILRDLAIIFNEDIDEYCVGMVMEATKYQHTAFNLKRLGLSAGSPYFNSGMAIFNLKKWREDEIEKKLFEWANKNMERILLVDQDIMNAVLNDQIKQLPEEYNVQLQYYNSTKKISKFSEKPYVIHYNGRKKPWLSTEMFCNDYFWRYAKYLKW